MNKSESAGLCGMCAYVRMIRNRKGSTFVLCELSRTREGFRRYPPLPVLSCPGYVRRTDEAEGDRQSGTEAM